MRHWNALLFTAWIALVVVSCKPVPVSHWFPVTPQEQYEKELLKNKLENTPAGQAWFRVGKAVLSDSLFSAAPHQEWIYLGDSVPAQSLRFIVPEGRNLIITPIRGEGDTVSRLFAELYRIRPAGKPQRLDYLRAGVSSLSSANHHGDTLLLRLQTGLHERLNVAISATTLPVLSFPVAGHGMTSVISTWGAERDRGARAHEGIDIRARRGTPAVAAADGFVTQAGTNNLGGKVVFLSAGDSPYTLYYAHLDSQFVSAGRRVTRGDTLGLVGNTGNAITTSPHLHFGIYVSGSGARDPLPFINDRKEKLPGLLEVASWLGDSVQLRRKTMLYLSSALSDRDKIVSVPANSRVQVIGEMAKGYRIVLEDGTRGYIPTVPLKKVSGESAAAVAGGK